MQRVTITPTLRYALPHALLYILSQFNIDRPYWNALPHALRYIFFCIVWSYLQRVKSCRQIYKKMYSEKRYSVQKMYSDACGNAFKLW